MLNIGALRDVTHHSLRPIIRSALAPLALKMKTHGLNIMPNINQSSKQHQVTRILIDWFHRRNGHVGPDHVLSLVREHYWVLNGLTVCKSVLGRCFFCRVRRAMKQFPFMADLPVARAAFGEPPFANCGADAIGPVVIKQGRKRL